MTENAPPSSIARIELEQRWLQLTREVLPSLSSERGFPVQLDHCFQRIFLDAACGGRWTDHVQNRPAYRSIDFARLERAVTLAEAVADAREDLHVLNRQSLSYRRSKRSPR